MQRVLFPQPVFSDLSFPENLAPKALPRPLSLGALDAAREAMKLKKAQWLTLTLRQTFADESIMRGYIKAAGLRSPRTLEPATVKRLRRLLTRADVRGPEIRTVVGTTLHQFLALNPLLPLWAALALVLESTGRFNQQAFELTYAAITTQP